MFAGQLWKILSSRRSLSSLVSTLVCDCRHNDFINHLPYLLQLWYCLWVHVQCFFLNCCAWAVALHQFTSKPYTFVCSALAASDNNLPPFLLPASAVNLTSQLSPEPSLVPHLVLISHLPSATWNGRVHYEVPGSRWWALCEGWQGCLRPLCHLRAAWAIIEMMALLLTYLLKCPQYWGKP